MPEAIAAPFRPLHFAIVGVVVSVNVAWITVLVTALADGMPVVQGLAIGAALFIEYRLARHLLDRARPVVVIDESGVFDRRCMIDPVPWADIAGLTVHLERRRYVRAFLVLEGVDPRRSIAPRWRRIERRVLRTVSGRPEMSVSLSDLAVTPQRIAEASRLWWEARAAVQAGEPTRPAA